MTNVLGQILPLAVGIAVSPLPIIAVILMLLSPRARATASGFLAGWLVGIVTATSAFTLFSSALPDEPSSAGRPVWGTLQLALGAGLLVLAFRQWRGRPRGDDEPSMPPWMRGIDSMTFWSATGLGLVLSAVNPKNLLLAASAGLAVGEPGLSAGELVAAVAVFALIAGSTILVPVVAYLSAARRLEAALRALRDWLTRENATIMAVLLLVLGVVLVGKGLSAL